MIRVYLCEDNKHLLSHYTNLVEMYIAFDELNLCLTYSTTDPLKLLMKLQDTDDTGLYFLDISLHASMDGFQLAKKIRALDPRGYIVFITTHSEMMSQTFKYRVEALDFIAKDEPDQLSYRIQQCLRAVAANDSTMQKQFKQPICIKLENQVIMLPSHDIIFIQSDPQPHKLTIHTRNGVKRISGTLKEMHGPLNSDFLRCHNSILVNKHHITQFIPENRILILSNGEQCPVSFRMIRTVKKEMLKNS